MTNIQINCYKEWDIYLATVAYEDKPEQNKIRPVLIGSDESVYLLTYKITSREPRNNCFYDYSIIDWVHAGLAKPSTIKLEKQIKLDKSKIIKKIGRLSQLDIIKVKLLIYDKSN